MRKNAGTGAAAHRKTVVLIALAILMFTGYPGGTRLSCRAEDGGTEADRTEDFRCREDRAACVLLQMAMAGEFHLFDHEDMLYLRVCSASLSRLCAITQEDIRHYQEEFDQEEEDVTDAWYRAISDCLWADILYRQDCGRHIRDSERVLLLFLDPASEEGSGDQIRQIRERIGEDTITLIAEEVGVSPEYVSWLIEMKTETEEAETDPETDPEMEPETASGTEPGP